MRKSIIDTASGRVVNVVLLDDGGGWVPPPGQQIGPNGGEIGDTWNGSTYVRPPTNTAPPSEADYTTAIQSVIDTTAQFRNYADGVSLASYSNSTNAQFKAEASAFIAWRDNVWLYAFAQLAAVQNGSRAQPSISQLLSELPSIQWPN